MGYQRSSGGDKGEPGKLKDLKLKISDETWAFHYDASSLFFLIMKLKNNVPVETTYSIYG